MIQEKASALAGAIDVAVGPDVAVYDHRPETAAGPCAYVEPGATRWARSTLLVGLRVTVMAGDGLEPRALAGELAAIADRVLRAAITTGAAGEGLSLSGSTRIVGETAYPVLEVTTTAVANLCDLPETPYVPPRHLAART
jgi:hypothetical protein